jgi:hypothetical protein
MYKNFDAEQVMLSDELKKKREDELFNKEKELRDLQKKDMVTKEIFSKKDRNSSNPYRIRFTAQFNAWLFPASDSPFLTPFIL